LVQAVSRSRSRARAWRPKAFSTIGSCRSWGARSAAWMRAASVSRPRWRPARLTSARSWGLVSAAPAAGVGAAARTARASGRSRRGLAGLVRRPRSVFGPCSRRPHRRD
jgi:hypothetical protein